MASRPEREVSLARFIPFKVRGLDGDEALCDDEIKLGVEEVSEDARDRGSYEFRISRYLEIPRRIFQQKSLPGDKSPRGSSERIARGVTLSPRTDNDTP